MLHLEAYCTGKVKGLDRSELLLGRPWTDEKNITWFRSKDFYKYLDQQHFREFKPKELYAVFRRHGCIDDNLMIKGKCVAAWGLPAFTEQIEELDEVKVLTEEDEEAF